MEAVAEALAMLVLKVVPEDMWMGALAAVRQDKQATMAAREALLPTTITAVAAVAVTAAVVAAAGPLILPAPPGLAEMERRASS